MNVDTHEHLGRSRFTGYETTASGLMASMDRYHIDAALVLPQATLDTASAQHDLIAAAVHNAPGKLFGVASICPWVGEDAYWAEARRTVEGMGFVALKLDTSGHGIAPNSGPARVVFECAKTLGVPVIVHTGTAIPNGLPALCIPAARDFPTVPIIMAHAGFAVYAAEALVAAQVADNLYVEPSWCAEYQVKEFVRVLGAERVLYGSDHLENIPVQLEKFRQAGLTPSQWDTIFDRNPRLVFRLSFQQ
jgi:predicted TIM-barrel fold metal-dependent hydrolase